MVEPPTEGRTQPGYGNALTPEEQPGIVAHVLTGCLVIACLLTLAILAGLAYGVWRWAL